jgi:hypothetical protein
MLFPRIILNWLAFCAPLAASCGGSERGASRLHAENDELEEAVVGFPVGSPASYSALRLGWLGQTANQYYSFGRFHDPSDPRYLLIVNGDPFSSISNLGAAQVGDILIFSASFDIVAVQAKTKNHYIVAGHDGSVDIIERWKEANVALLGGGSQLTLKRTTLFRGDLGGIQSIGIDHLGRYLIIVHGSPTVVSRMALPGGNPVALLSGATIPQLNVTMDSVYPRQHATSGVIWTLEPLGPQLNGDHYFTLLFDNQDDGVIDAHEMISYSDYRSYYPPGTPAWTDCFLAD